MSGSPPGWHPDPEYPGMQRYWNGSQWTDTRRPAGAGPAGPPAAKASGCASGALIGLGVVLVLGLMASACVVVVANRVGDKIDEKADHLSRRIDRAVGPADPGDFALTTDSCTVGANGFPVASGHIRNTSRRRIGFRVEVDFLTGATLVGNDSAFVGRLDQGGDGTWCATSLSTVTARTEVTCRVVQVSYWNFN